MTLISEGEWSVLTKPFGGPRATEPLMRLATKSDGTGKRLLGNKLTTLLLPTRVAILISGEKVALRPVKTEDPGNIIRRVSTSGKSCSIAATGLPGSVGTWFKVVPEGDLFLLRRTN